MRVLHVITGLETGGAEALLYRLVTYLQDPRIAHSVCSLKGEGTYAQRLREKGIPVYALSGHIPRLIHDVLAVARRVNPGLIQGWMYHGNMAAALCRLRNASNAPLLWSVHQTLSSFRNEKFGTMLTIRAGSALSRLPVQIIYNSVVSARQHEALGYRSDKTMMIPSGFDTDLFRPDPARRQRLRAELHVSDDAALIGAVARVHPMKDQPNFLRAAQKVKATLPNAVFLLAGKGTDSPELVRLACGLGIGDNVRLLGERSDIPTIMAAIDVLVMCSAWGEAFPTVIGEAMACGAPCVVTDVGDAGRLVGDTGTTVPPRDSELLARALLSLLEREDFQTLRLRARERIVAKYSSSVMTEKYKKLYAQILQFPEGRSTIESVRPEALTD